jgi:hypothetical protein
MVMENSDLDVKEVIKTVSYPVHVELPDGMRMIAYHPEATSEEEVRNEVLRLYEASGRILEVSEETARNLGFTSKRLIEMALTRLENAEDTLN